MAAWPPVYSYGLAGEFQPGQEPGGHPTSFEVYGKNVSRSKNCVKRQDRRIYFPLGRKGEEGREAAPARSAGAGAAA